MQSVSITTNVVSSNPAPAICDKVCQWFATGRWFSPGPPVSSINKTDRHNITEILLKVALNTINQTWNLCGENIKIVLTWRFIRNHILIFLILNSTCSIKTISAKTRMQIFISWRWFSPSWKYFCWKTWRSTPEAWTPCIFHLTKTANKTKMIGWLLFNTTWWDSCCSILNFLCSVLYIVVCPFVLFLLATVLSVLLRFTDSDYPFVIVIFKLFLCFK